jgi:hypothetical protein
VFSTAAPLYLLVTDLGLPQIHLDNCEFISSAYSSGYNPFIAIIKMQEQQQSNSEPYKATPEFPAKMASRSHTKREKPSHPIILSIPLEIRQYILSYAFVEAVAQDITFNAKLQKVIPEPGLGEGLFLATLDDLKDPIFADHEYDGVKRSESLIDRPPCAPRIYAMANKISAVHPQLKEEVKFVFKQCLEQFRS